jgi:hypothetical protein
MSNKKTLLVIVAKAIIVMWKELPYSKFAPCVRQVLPDYIASNVLHLYATQPSVGLHAIVDELRKEELA